LFITCWRIVLGTFPSPAASWNQDALFGNFRYSPACGFAWVVEATAQEIQKNGSSRSSKMMKMTLLLTIGVLGVLFVAACAEQKPVQTIVTPLGVGLSMTATSIEVTPVISVSSGSSGTPLNQTTPNLPVATQPQPVPGGQLVVTRDDQGKTINLKVADSILLQLGGEFTWDVSLSTQNVLSRVKNITVVNGAQGVYTANQTGTVTLTATGDPLCRQVQPPCGMPSIVVEITFVVS
jgi:hypothetical protein